MSRSSSLRRGVPTVLSAALLGVGLVSTGAAPAHAAAACGSTSGGVINHISTQGVSCVKAKHVANAWEDKAIYGDFQVHPDVHVKGFHCHATIGAGKVRCTDGAKVVRFRSALV